MVSASAITSNVQQPNLTAAHLEMVSVTPLGLAGALACSWCDHAGKGRQYVACVKHQALYIIVM